MESGTLADAFPDGVGDRASLRSKTFRDAGSGPASSCRGKGGDLSGRGDQPDGGAALAVSAGGRKTGPVMPGADHSGTDHGDEGVDPFSSTGGEKTADSRGDNRDREPYDFIERWSQVMKDQGESGDAGFTVDQQLVDEMGKEV